MTELTFAELTTPLTLDQCEQFILDRLNELEFTVTSWSPDDPVVTLIKAFAARDQRLSQMVAFYTLNRFNRTATNTEIVTEISRSDFDNTRSAAVATQYNLRLTLAPGQPPITFTIGSFVASTEDGLKTYRNIEAKTLTSVAPITLLCEAEVAGAVGNAGLNTVTNVVTSYAGVTVTNDTAPIRSGVDPESNAAIQLRNRQKWATLSIENTNAAIEYLIKTQVPEIVSVAINDLNPRGPGTVDMYVAGPLATASPAAVASALLVARARYFDANPRIQVVAAPVGTFIPGGVLLYNPTIGEAKTLENVDAALRALLTALPVGGRSYQSGDSNVLLRDDVIDTVKEANGVISFIPSGSGNYAVGSWTKLIPPVSWSFTLTPTTVT